MPESIAQTLLEPQEAPGHRHFPGEPFPGGTQPDPPVTRTFGWAIGELKAKTRLKHGA